MREENKHALACLPMAPSRFLAAHAGRIAALFALILSLAVTFADIRLTPEGLTTLTLELSVYLFSVGVIYFSLAAEGEKAGRETKEYQQAEEEFLSLAGQVTPKDYGALALFCRRCVEEELTQRRQRLLLFGGATEEEYQRFLAGEATKHTALFLRVGALRPANLTPSLLLSLREGRREELYNPTAHRLGRRALRLLPTLLTMSFTVSVALCIKTGTDSQAVAEGVFRICALLLSGCKGFLQGMSYTTEALTPWLLTKARLLRAFGAEEPS